MAASATAPLRVGRIVALNMYPVYHQLERAGLTGVRFTDGLPATLNHALLDGELDVSAMSSIEYARNADRLELLPIGSISAAGAVDSIQLFSRVPFEDVRSIAITPHSATSVALLRVLVGPDVVFRPMRRSLERELAAEDGVLLIADEALHALRAAVAPYATDLGARWQEMTGLPMVFAVWAARRDLDQRDELERLSMVIADAEAGYRADPSPVVAAAAERFPFPAEYVADYFARLSYAFGPPERAGLARFLALAHDARELDVVPALAA